MRKSKDITKYNADWQIVRSSIKGSKFGLEEKLSKVKNYFNSSKSEDRWERAVNWCEGLIMGYKASKNLDADDYASVLLGVINGWRVAVVGQTSSEDTKSNLADDPQLKVAPQLENMNQILTAVEGKVDVIIALTHIGYQQSGKVEF